jgi:GNAT superfamily N-acetyltransferase
VLSISSIAASPENFETEIIVADAPTLKFRPLLQSDADILKQFLTSLSQTTRNRWMSGGYEPNAATELCDAIGRFDKLRMVLVTHASNLKELVGLFEFSFGIPASDVERFSIYGINLIEGVHVRFGPCLCDDYQGRSIAPLVMAYMRKIAADFGNKHIILWGGVLVNNEPAIKFYEGQGFRKLGKFISAGGKESLDMILDL